MTDSSGGMMRIKKTHFLVPTHEDHDIGNGELHSTNRWEKLQSDLIVMFGAWHTGPGTYQGMYKDPDTGKQVLDASMKYVVAIEEDRVSDLRQYLSEEVAVQFKQKLIYFYNGSEVEFLESDEIL